MRVLNMIGSNRKISKVFLKFELVLSLLLYVCGIVWFLVLCYAPFNAETYFSENALLPGLVTNEFNQFREIEGVLVELKNAVSRAEAGSVPRDWIYDRFQRLGLEVHVQNFSLRHPLAFNQTVEGCNVYAILRAHRGSSTEGLVLTAPMPRGSASAELMEGYTSDATAAAAAGDAVQGVAMVLALAKYFSQQIYWAKDIVFLISDRHQLGVSAWLSAYHHPRHHTHTHLSDNQWLQAGDLTARAGSLQAAIGVSVTKFATSASTFSAARSKVNVQMEGVNGQLPNLDLVNLAHRLFHQERLPHTNRHRTAHSRPDSGAGFSRAVWSTLSMMAQLATTLPSGAHGVFTRFGVNAVTLQFRVATSPSTTPTSATSSLLQLCRVLEGMFRSLNNLQERFHQSYFFYLLTSSNRFISIDMYLPPFALLVSGVLLRALACWLSAAASADSCSSSSSSTQCSSQSSTGCQVSDRTQAGTSPVTDTKKLSQNELVGYYNLSSAQSYTAIICVVVFAYAFGSMCFGVLPCLVRFVAARGASVAAGCLVGLGTIASLSALFIWQSHRLCGSLSAAPCLFDCVVHLQLGVFLFVTALFNISLATLVGAVYCPLAMLLPSAGTCQSRLLLRLRRCVCWLLLVVANPLWAQLWLPAAIDVYWSNSDANSAWQRSLDRLPVALNSWLLYGANQLQLGCCYLLPLWLQLACVLRAGRLATANTLGNSAHLKQH